MRHFGFKTFPTLRKVLNLTFLGPCTMPDKATQLSKTSYFLLFCESSSLLSKNFCSRAPPHGRLHRVLQLIWKIERARALRLLRADRADGAGSSGPEVVRASVRRNNRCGSSRRSLASLGLDKKFVSSVLTSKRGGRSDTFCWASDSIKIRFSFYLFFSFLVLEKELLRPDLPCSILHYRFATSYWLESTGTTM